MSKLLGELLKIYIIYILYMRLPAELLKTLLTICLFSYHSFRENYLFVCSCQKCMAQMDDADLTSEDEDEGEGETEGDEMEDEMTDVWWRSGFGFHHFPTISYLYFCGQLHFHIIMKKKKGTRVNITSLQLCSCSRRVSSWLCKAFCLTFTPLIPITLVVPRMLPFSFLQTDLFRLFIITYFIYALTFLVYYDALTQHEVLQRQNNPHSISLSRL